LINKSKNQNGLPTRYYVINTLYYLCQEYDHIFRAHMKYASLNGHKIVILGFGSIGPAVLPLILRHIDINPEKIEVVSTNDSKRNLAEELGIAFTCFKLTKANYQAFLKKRLRKGDVLLNLAYSISSFDLIYFCAQRQALYLDTSIDNWNNNYLTYDIRIALMQKKHLFENGSTALVSHGANPGLISHFAKHALLDVSKKILKNEFFTKLREKSCWGELAKAAGVVCLHISEKDTQRSVLNRKNEYANTWSIDAFLDEAYENAMLAWGSHEIDLSKQVVKRNEVKNNNRVVTLTKRAAEVKIKSLVPSSGNFHGFLVPHTEVFSLAELLLKKYKNFTYQPSIYFVYHPCPSAVFAIRNPAVRKRPTPKQKQLLFDDIIEGHDEFGILIFRKDSPDVYWFGSRLDIHEARHLAPNNNATSLQVSAGILAGLVWIIENPEQGLIEPEAVNFERALEIATPYLGKLEGHWVRWPDTKILPGQHASYTWQFSEFLVAPL
jgi:homospermidine synthase